MNDIEKAMKGDSEAFNRLILEYKSKFYKTAILVLKNEDDAYDAIQETLISIYHNISKLNNPEAFGGWSKRILMNKCYDIIQKNKKVVDITQKAQIDYDEMIVDKYDCEDELVGILDKLDKDLQLVTIFYYYDEMSVGQIAEVLNIPEGTVKSRLSRARTKLYDILKDEKGDGANG
ncbi:MAG: sigma-70 family RNA polymerase sigma factor [Clostridia bacterium]|nr:sigma-70 family RNA polymerase sigma factor [Clostridia bacterium]